LWLCLILTSFKSTLPTDKAKKRAKMEEEVLEPLAQYFCTFLHCVAVDSCPHPLHLRKGAKTGGESKGGWRESRRRKDPRGFLGMAPAPCQIVMQNLHNTLCNYERDKSIFPFSFSPISLVPPGVCAIFAFAFNFA